MECSKCHTNGTFQGPSTAVHVAMESHLNMLVNLVRIVLPCGLCLLIFDHPEPRVGKDGNGINRGGTTTCRECYPTSFKEATCVACYEGNNFEGGGG